MTVKRHTMTEIHTLTMLVRKLTRQAREAQLAALGIDLTMLQHAILHLTSEQNPTITELARALGLDPSTLVPSVDAMVKKGYITRERDPDDRRRYPLQLTAAGKDLYQTLQSAHKEDALLRALSTLPADDVAHITRILRHIVSELPGGQAMLAEVNLHHNACFQDND